MSPTRLAPLLGVTRTGFIDARTVSIRTFIAYSHARTSPCQQAKARSSAVLQARTFMGWFDAAFNRYDEARVKEVGADRAAAEWLLRCGAGEGVQVKGCR